MSGTMGSGEEIGRILRIHARKIEQLVGELANRANVATVPPSFAASSTRRFSRRRHH
jgi:hypothetical protein